MIHTPEDFPDITASYKVYSELNLSLRMSISVIHMKADKSLSLVNEKARKCFLFDPTIRIYKSNAEENCYSRCRLKTTKILCKCVPYYFYFKGIFKLK